MTFEKHNEEVKRVWEAYRAGRPVRVPLAFGINARYLLLDDALNTSGVTFKEYSDDPEVMLSTQLAFQEYVRFNVPQDAEMGLPQAWNVSVDMQNYYEAGFLGAPVYFPEGNVPAAEIFLTGDGKRSLLDAGPVDLDKSPLWRKNIEFYEYFLEKKRQGYEFRGRPIGEVGIRGLGTDGPLTLFMSIRGGEGLVDMYVDEEYFHAMMDYLTEFSVAMIRKARRISGQQERQDIFGFADDSIELISVDDYKRHILPYHKRLAAELGAGRADSIHICGDVQRHFPTLISELGVKAIDTGFPINWETLRDEVGEGVEISGGVHVATLLRGSPGDVRAETERILATPITRGGRFMMREANNLAPLTPVASLAAMYEAVKEFGRY